jgi:5-oxoprolinase (ATP-hydrolysing) subunit A
MSEHWQINAAPKRYSLDINADVGEGGAGDAEIFASGITSANVACGGHAGDASTMAAACALAVQHGVALGAHPGFADREYFGRREQSIGLAELGILLSDQVLALQREARRAGAVIRHVKPHGALYHFLNREPQHALLFVSSVPVLAPGAAIYGPPRGALREACAVARVRFVAEGFVDRAYRSDGTLVPRGEAGAVIPATQAMVAQAVRLAQSGEVATLCAHGDGVEAARNLSGVRAALVAAGYHVAAPSAICA